MKNLSPILLTLLLLLFAAAPVCADSKNKVQKEELRPLMPEPDERPSTLHPQPSLHPILPLSIPTLPLAVAHRRNACTGIDVSHYQGKIDWRAVAATGKVQYVYLKATESTSLVDDTYAYNLREAKAAGVAVGCYHFFSPSTDAAAQLKNFTDNVSLSNHDLVPMVDVELRGKSTLPQFISRLRTFVQGIERHYGVKPILYTSVNFYEKYLAGHFDDYVYMIARYADEIPQMERACHFGLWQYSATGRIEGIRGAVDLSCFVDAYGLDDIRIKK